MSPTCVASTPAPISWHHQVASLVPGLSAPIERICTLGGVASRDFAHFLSAALAITYTSAKTFQVALNGMGYDSNCSSFVGKRPLLVAEPHLAFA